MEVATTTLWVLKLNHPANHPRSQLVFLKTFNAKPWQLQLELHQHQAFCQKSGECFIIAAIHLIFNLNKSFFLFCRDKLEAFITIHDSQAATHQQIQTNIIEKLDQHYENSNSSSHNFQEKIFAQLSSLSSLVLELSVKLEAHENKIFSTLGHIMKQQKEHETSLVALLSAYESGGLKNCHTILDSMLQQHPFPAKHLQDQPVNIQTRIKASSALHAGLQKMNTRSATKKRTRQPHFHDDDDVCSHADDDEKSSNSNPYKRVPHYHQVPFFQAFSQKESVGNTSIEIIDLVTDKDMGDITDDDKVSDAVSPRLARRLARHLKASIESKRLFLKPEQ